MAGIDNLVDKLVNIRCASDNNTINTSRHACIIFKRRKKCSLRDFNRN